MELGFIGLGRMGGNMVERILLNKSIRVVAYDRTKEVVDGIAKQGAVAAHSVPELVGKLEQDRKIIWMMLPAGNITEGVFQEVLSLTQEGDIIIDGANSHFHDTKRRHRIAKEKGVSMLDVGVSGGIVAADLGYPMMIGGERNVWEFCKPIFDALGLEDGYDLVGEDPGSGHYVKMIHNAIEYGMMQAISEGFDLLKNGSSKS